MSGSPGRDARARSRNSRTDSEAASSPASAPAAGTASGATTNRTSPVQVQHLPAGRQHPHPRTFGQHARGHPRRLLDHRFATIQDQQHVGLAQALDHPRQRVRGLASGRARPACAPPPAPRRRAARRGQARQTTPRRRSRAPPPAPPPAQAGSCRPQADRPGSPAGARQPARPPRPAPARDPRTRSPAPADGPAAPQPRERWPGRGRGPGSPPAAAATPAPARPPAARPAPAEPARRPPAPPPGGRCDTGPASAAPTAAPGTDAPPAPGGSGRPPRCAPPAPAPPRTAPPARRSAAPPGGRPPHRPSGCPAGPAAAARATAPARGRPARRPGRRHPPAGAAGPGQQLLEPQGVHGGTRQRVPVRGGNDRLGSKRGAEPRNVVLDGVARRHRDLRPPQGVDQHLDRDHATAPQGQQRQQRMPLGAGYLCGATTDEDLERAQKPDLERGRHGGETSDAGGPVWHAPTHL